MVPLWPIAPLSIGICALPQVCIQTLVWSASAGYPFLAAIAMVEQSRSLGIEERV